MRFLDELKEKRQDAIENVAGIDIDIEATKITLKSEQEQRAFWTKRIAEIDIAIAALKAADDHAYFAEKATAREQLEREPEIEPVPIDEQGDASEFAQPMPDAEFVALDEQTCEPLDTDLAQILHDNMDKLLITDEAPALNEAMQDERTCTCHPSDRPFECMKQYAASECIAAFEAKYPSALTTGLPHPEPVEGYAPVTNPEAHIQAVEAERYALATNPEADALARAHDYSDPKAVADRERNAGLAKLFSYNPFYKPKVEA